MDSLLLLAVTQVKASRGYWTKLPQTACAHDKLAPLPASPEGDCWNGKERSKYIKYYLFCTSEPLFMITFIVGIYQL